VEKYVETQEPVGSQTILDCISNSFDVSSATIRNDMMKMKSLGFIQQPHTSAGSIPTELGYQEYVKILKEQETPNIESIPFIDSILDDETKHIDDAVKESMELVSNLTNYTAIVLGPEGASAKIKRINFVSLGDDYGVLILVTDTGYVESKKIKLPDYILSSEIEKTISFLNELVVDKEVREIETALKDRLLHNEINEYSSFYDMVIAALVKTLSVMAQEDYFLSGKTNIIKQPEFKDADKIRDLIDLLENKELFGKMAINKDKPEIRIGTENKISILNDCAIVSVPYEIDGKKWAIAMVGPTRMEYHKIIPLLEYIAKRIKKTTKEDK